VSHANKGEREQDKETQPKTQASLDSCNEWREILHRWSSEERMTCRKGCKITTGERLGQGWSKHFCHMGGLPLKKTKKQLFKH